MSYFIELSSFVLLIFILFALAVDNVRQRVFASKLNKEINQLVADYIALSKKLEEAVKNADEKKIEQTDGFLKFVSESRDWAFQYIEEVQSAIVKLKKESSRVPLVPGSYLLAEELEDLRKAIADVLRQLPDDSKND
jgi:NTP pyrophosphatase (non-canonical NTP hydrolase)